jgi:nucleoside-diphosphate-sugar epimerase
MTGRTLVTGADGYLGIRIADRLLADTDDRLLLTVRAAGREELSAKRAALLARLGARGDGRVDVIPVDLRQAEPFAGVDPGGVTAVVHTAARTAFSVEHADAAAVNVDGTARVVAFARNCPALDRLLVLSTLFSAGRRVGAVGEERHDDGTGFANFYEWSKFEAERMLLDRCTDLPLTIARLATMVADDDTGVAGQHNAFHNTLKLFFYGLMSLMPGEPKTPLYLATADFTTRGVVHLSRPGVPAGIYHLAPGPAEVMPLGDLIDVVFDVFERDPGYRRRRLLRPGFCDIESFRDLVAASKRFAEGPMRQALDWVAPFAEQMFLPKDFDNSRLRATWTGYAVPPPRPLVAAACAWLVRTRWGRSAEEAPCS